MVYLSAAERRSRARTTALQLLAEGTPVADLTLRQVAARQEIPLSTLTSVYRSVTDLLDDVAANMAAPLYIQVGSGGLRRELMRFTDATLDDATRDPAHRAISLYVLRRIGLHPERNMSEERVQDFVPVIASIREKAGEHYRLSDEVIARTFRLLFEGAYLQWVDAGGSATSERELDERWRGWIEMGIDVIVAAADPQPVGPPHERGS